MICKNCKAFILDDCKRCPSCGQKVETESVAPPNPMLASGFMLAGDLEGSNSGMGASVEKKATLENKPEPELRFSSSFNRPSASDLSSHDDISSNSKAKRIDDERKKVIEPADNQIENRCLHCGATTDGSTPICKKCIRKQNMSKIKAAAESVLKNKKLPKISIVACCVLLVAVLAIVGFGNADPASSPKDTDKQHLSATKPKPTEKHEFPGTSAVPETGTADKNSETTNEMKPSETEVEETSAPVNEAAQILSNWYFNEFDRTNAVISVLADVTHDGNDDLVIVLNNTRSNAVEGFVYSVSSGTVRMVEKMFFFHEDPIFPFALYLKKADNGYNLIQETTTMFMGYGENELTEYYLNSNDSRIVVDKVVLSAEYPNHVTEEQSNRFTREGEVVLEGAYLICFFGPNTEFSAVAERIGADFVLEQK